MKKLIRPFYFSCTALMSAVFLLSLFRVTGEEFDDIGTRQASTASKWGGLLWKQSERNIFKGRPKTATDNDTSNFVTVAYGRFVSYYDVKHLAPCWVAYVTDKASAIVTDNRSRPAATFPRPSGGFFTDGVIADASAVVDVDPTEHEDYSDMVPEGVTDADTVSKTFSVVKARSAKGIIERGHLASNNTMKTWGTTSQGKIAQNESFSLANVVPQMKAHNAPTWSALEKQCLNWARELDTVCVVTGPIYNDRDHPRHIQDRMTGQPSGIPFPDALFCVVIGKRAGTTAAIGFIMPQMTAKYSFKVKAVPIDEIEKATAINFMPELGEPNPLEQTVDVRWINN